MYVLGEGVPKSMETAKQIMKVIFNQDLEGNAVTISSDGSENTSDGDEDEDEDNDDDDNDSIPNEPPGCQDCSCGANGCGAKNNDGTPIP